jgi:hypothetical protein
VKDGRAAAALRRAVPWVALVTIALWAPLVVPWNHSWDDADPEVLNDEAKDLALADAQATIARAEAEVLVGRVEWSAARRELLAHLGLEAPETR